MTCTDGIFGKRNGGAEAAGEDGMSEQDDSALLTPWPGVPDAIGRPARTFAEWARDHAEDFR
ncbi:hypothetical protein JOF56_009521 [Kibdelosporangium banguiense]|uniref:Uncharacterized protein n=1 Tax=Kibdelosporangium banguiense TaxID=1365924 RepID=A0ABS4TXN3_9PSEU|nr:hypothetical protein [Kibdelosporangium banguiense]MBP2329136.1 hypothetical protein [Kibdelosporangium banguiense]